MKNYLLLFFCIGLLIDGVAQEKVAIIDPGYKFSAADYSIGYLNNYDNSYRITFQNGTSFLRLEYGNYPNDTKKIDIIKYNGDK